MPSSDLAALRGHLAKANKVAVLTGAGVSAESGVPTFRGAGGLWRKYSAPDLASPVAFRSDPSLVWEFYHHRREVVLTKSPNAAHRAIADYEARMRSQGKEVTVITQNVDELHRAAGTTNLLELHGSLFRVRCTQCGKETENRASPICPASEGKGAPDVDARDARISVEDLPRCDCEKAALLRPAIVWFGENLDPAVLGAAERAVESCDVCLVVGTSSVVYPAAMFAPAAAARGAIVAEFNTESTPVTQRFQFHFKGPCGSTLPAALEQ